MKCWACGVELAADAVYCQKCGARIDSGNKGQPTNGAKPAGETNFPTSSADHRHDLANEPEHELWQGGYSGKAMYGSWLLAILLTAGIIVASVIFPPALPLLACIPLPWLAIIIYLFYRKLNVHYTLTNQRFIHQSGILIRSTDRFEVIQIDDVTIMQGLIERMLGIGTIRITSSSDKTHPELLLEGIDDVQRISGLIDDTRRKDRRRRGVYMEQM